MVSELLRKVEILQDGRFHAKAQYHGFANLNAQVGMLLPDNRRGATVARLGF